MYDNTLTTSGDEQMTYCNAPVEVVLDPWHRTPLMFEEWRERGSYYQHCYLDEVDRRFMEALDRKRRPWAGQNYFNWARDPANRRE